MWSAAQDIATEGFLPMEKQLAETMQLSKQGAVELQ